MKDNMNKNLTNVNVVELDKGKTKGWNDAFVDHDIIDDWMTTGDNMESSFIPIDRDKEDINVLEFQRTGDLMIMEGLYLNRVQTLEIWASRYGYLNGGIEDMFSELVQVFLKAVNGYKKKRKCNVNGKCVIKTTPFNTYLWYSIVNYIRNLKSGKRAKKRRAIGYEGSLSNMIISIESPYFNKDGSETRLIDFISEDLKMAVRHNNDVINLKEVLEIMSNKDLTFKKFLKKICDGHSLASAIKDCKTLSGKVKLNKSQCEKFKTSKKYNRIVSKLITNRHKIKYSFKLIKYTVNKNYLHYSIELNKTKEVDIILKMVRLLKKNKDRYIHKISA